MVYHEGRDWLIEKRGPAYWSFPLDAESWHHGPPSGMELEDIEALL